MACQALTVPSGGVARSVGDANGRAGLMPPKIGWPIWVGVVADDLAAQTAFYREVLGLRQTGSGPDWVHFELDGGILEVLERSSLPQYDARRVQVGFEVDDIAVAREAL